MEELRLKKCRMYMDEFKLGLCSRDEYCQRIAVLEKDEFHDHDSEQPLLAASHSETNADEMCPRSPLWDIEGGVGLDDVQIKNDE